MATTQKKKGGSRTASTGKRTASPSKAGRAKSASNPRETAPARKPMRREIGAVVCLLLAVFSSFGYFHLNAIFIDFLVGMLKGLMGYGYLLMPPALLFAAYVLFFHHGRPVALRLTCTLLLPLMISAMFHGILAQVLPWDKVFVKALWESGEALHSGGVVAACWGSCAWCYSPAWAPPSSLGWPLL